MIRIVSLVSNDIVTDNRVHKIATTLQGYGYVLKIVGRKFKNSELLIARPYSTRRFRLWFNKGPLFYANLNIRFFFYLLGARTEIILANDLDTLPACWLASKIKRKVLIFDSHELFSEVPELAHRPVIRKIWSLLERLLVKRIKNGITVSASIADYYNNKYKKQFEVIRNVGQFRYDVDFEGIDKDNRTPIIIYQGALNMGRGIELAIKCMKFVKNAKLQIIGDGDIRDQLKKLTDDLQLNDRIEFVGRVPMENLWNYTSGAHIGISLEEDLGLNYRYALPNKLFDYIQARIPVVVSDLPELKAIVTQYKIGIVLTRRTPENLGEIFNRMLKDEMSRHKYLTKLELAARELCWEREEEKLIRFFKRVGT